MIARKNPPSFILVDKSTGEVVYTKRATGVGSEAISKCVERGHALARRTGRTYFVYLDIMGARVGMKLSVPMAYALGITEEISPSGSVRPNPRGAVRRNVYTFNNPVSGPADPTAARELELYIDNDADLYRQQFVPIVKNLMLKRRKGVYNRELAVKLFMYLMDSGAKKYVREFGTGGNIDTMFNRNTRMQAARAFRDSFETEAELGNYDRMIGPVSNPEYRVRFTSPDMRFRHGTVRAHGTKSALKKANRMAEKLPPEFTAPRSMVEVDRSDVRKNVYTFNNPLNEREHREIMRSVKHDKGVAAAYRDRGDEFQDGVHRGRAARAEEIAHNYSPLSNPARKLNAMERAASLFNLSVAAWAPGDGVTRYRFFKASGHGPYADYHQGGAIYTANGRGEALKFLKSYGIGRSRMNPCSNPVCKNPRHKHVLKNPLLQTVLLANPGSMKTFSEMQNIGNAKYVVNYHDGVKVHRDGSPFFDIAIFRSRAKKDQFVRKLKSLGFTRGAIQNPPISMQWDSLTGRQRLQVLGFVGFDETASRYVRLPWKLLSNMVKQALEQYWNDSTGTRGTTRRRMAPVGANPLTRRESGKILRSANRSLEHGAIFRPGHTRSAMAGKAIGKAHVVTDFGPRSARGAARKIHNRAEKMVGTTMSNPGVRFPKPGTKMTVASALELARRIGDRGLIEQCRKALKLQKAANRDSKCVIWKTFPMGSKGQIDSVVALTHYGDSPETMYKPPPGSKKGNHMYRHTWGEKGGKKSVPLLASADGKMLLMPLEGRKVAGDWLRH